MFAASTIGVQVWIIFHLISILAEILLSNSEGGRELARKIAKIRRIIANGFVRAAFFEKLRCATQQVTRDKDNEYLLKTKAEKRMIIAHTLTEVQYGSGGCTNRSPKFTRKSLLMHCSAASTVIHFVPSNSLDDIKSDTFRVSIRLLSHRCTCTLIPTHLN